MLHRGQPGQHLVQHRAAVVHSTAPHLAVEGNQQLGFDLPEAVEHSHRAHVGRTHLHSPPTLATARNATMVCGVLGR